jgi:hypothetical protein
VPLSALGLFSVVGASPFVTHLEFDRQASTHRNRFPTKEVHVSRKLTMIAAVALAALAASITAFAATRDYGGGSSMGMTHNIVRPAFFGYYDGHKDTYLNTDVSDKAQAAAMHINYSTALGKIPMSHTEEIYLVEGKAAAGQLAVFSSEPGEATYTPIWHEVVVKWKASATPVLLVKDDQIDDLAKKGMLTARDSKIILNCPIVKVGKGGS